MILSVPWSTSSHADEIRAALMGSSHLNAKHHANRLPCIPGLIVKVLGFGLRVNDVDAACMTRNETYNPHSRVMLANETCNPHRRLMLHAIKSCLEGSWFGV